MNDPTLNPPPHWEPDAIDHRLLEGLAAGYCQQVETRRALVVGLRQAVLDAAIPHLPGLRAATAAERDARATLLQAVSDAPALFARPRTRNAHGIKYGWALGKASIAIDDEARTIKLIRSNVPEEQQILLIRVTEKVDRRAVLDLSARDLKRLAIRHVAGEDAPLVSLPKDDLDKLVDTLLAETTGGEA